MLLLTGATGTVGSALLARLTARGEAVRCLVRDPRRLGDQRVRVQIALGDLADPQSFRHALRGVDTVIHLAASIRDQPGGLDRGAQRPGHLAAVQAAERAGVRRFVFFSRAGRHEPPPRRASSAPRPWPSGPWPSPRCPTRSSRRRSSTRPATPG